MELAALLPSETEGGRLDMTGGAGAMFCWDRWGTSDLVVPLKLNTFASGFKPFFSLGAVALGPECENQRREGLLLPRLSLLPGALNEPSSWSIKPAGCASKGERAARWRSKRSDDVRSDPE